MWGHYSKGSLKLLSISAELVEEATYQDNGLIGKATTDILLSLNGTEIFSSGVVEDFDPASGTLFFYAQETGQLKGIIL